MATPHGDTMEWVDRIADQFERAWRLGKRPVLESFVDGSDDRQRTALLVELVKIDTLYRTALGEKAAWDEYVIRFPALANYRPAEGRSADLPVRRRLGDFEIMREIGRGGMGVVYEARQVSLGRKVALKVLSSTLGLTPQAVQRFKREAEAAARLHHTNIVPVYATGEQDGAYFYAMELIEGPSLDRVIRNARNEAADSAPQSTRTSDAAAVTDVYHKAESSGGDSAKWSSSSFGSSSQYFDTVARQIAEVADALDYAHRQGIIHRDIKPSNLMVSPDGKLSLNDFGLARMLEQPGMTMTGEMLGTPAYMSPEQIIAGRVPLDHRTDVYSLGATLYELLTLHRPFQGEHRDQILAQIVHKEPRPPRRINRKVPIDLETICLKALEKDPDRRYQTAGAMADDLRCYVNRFAISARRVGPVGRLVKLSRRHPGLAAGLACAIAALVTAAFFAVDAYQAEQQRLIEQELARVQIAATKREHALENALIAATSGDLEKAEKAIGVAEAHGASAADVRRLRGQVAYFRGDWKRAKQELEQATRLDPTSVAARAMLATHELNAYQWTVTAPMVADLEAMPARTAEDYLFKGVALTFFDQERALQAFNEAVKRSSSPLVRSLRSAARAVKAQYSADLDEVERAITDAEVAKEYLPDNPIVLCKCVYANLVAANLYEELKNFERQQALLRAAELDVQALEPFELLPSPAMVRVNYFHETGQESASFNVARRVAKETKDAPITGYYVMGLYGKGRFAEALDVIDSAKDNPYCDIIRAYVLAELHPNNHSIARAACQTMAARYPPGGGIQHVTAILKFLGNADEAVALNRAERQKLPAMSPNDPNKWLWDYRCADVAEDELLKHLDRNRFSRFFANFEIALTRLANGDRAGARDFFQRAEEMRMIGWYESRLVRIFRKRLEKDPTWPPWIPLKD